MCHSSCTTPTYRKNEREQDHISTTCVGLPGPEGSSQIIQWAFRVVFVLLEPAPTAVPFPSWHRCQGWLQSSLVPPMSTKVAAMAPQAISVCARVQRCLLMSVPKARKASFQILLLYLIHLPQFWDQSPVHPHYYYTTLGFEDRSYASKKTNQLCPSWTSYYQLRWPPWNHQIPTPHNPISPSLTGHKSVYADFPIIFLLATLKNEQSPNIIHLRKIPNKKFKKLKTKQKWGSQRK